MRIPEVHAAHDSAQIEPLVFFAQCLAELLFDHTLDSFKAPALDTSSRALELAALAHQAMSGNHGVRALSPVIDELQWSLSEDPAVRAHAKIMANKLMGAIKSSVTDPRILAQNTATLLLHLRNYWPDVKNLIIDCLADSHRKHDLVALAASLTTQIELLGFSRRYAYHLTTELFYRKFASPQPIQDVQQLAKDFLANFEQDGKDWNVIYRGNQEFTRFAGHTQHYDMTVSQHQTEQILNANVIVNTFLGQNEDFPCYVKIGPINARDNFAAREGTDRVLEEFVEACKFHRHTSSLAFDSSCVVIDTSTGNAVLLKPNPHPLACGRESSWNEASEGIHRTTEILRGAHLDDESTRRFANALEYHRAAIETPKLENQLLDLWAAIEGFLPQPKGQTRITHYLAALLPPITLTYSEKLFRYISDELERPELGPSVRTLVNGSASSGDFFEKTVRLIVAEEAYSFLEQLMPLLGRSPLLRYRIYRLHESFKSAVSIRTTLHAHTTKVGWHIQRIYGTRNMIMHSAQAFRYLRTLVENLHAYIDVLIPAVSKLAVASPMRLDINAAIQLLANHEEVVLSSLKAAGNTRCNASNFKQLVFGENNPLSPLS